MTEIDFNPRNGGGWVRAAQTDAGFYEQPTQKNPETFTNNIVERFEPQRDEPLKKIGLEIQNRSDNPLPKYEHPFDSGFDLRAFIEGDGENEKRFVQIFPMNTKLINTGLYMRIPRGYEGQIRTRSGLALKQQIVVTNSPGTIDADYRNEVGVILTNLGNKIAEIHNGDRIAQMVICPVADESKVVIVAAEGNVVDDNTERGLGGMGSTGIK
jgi:dUTP pyrophosphatase